MTLLTEVMDHPLDPGYAEAAAARAAGARRGGSRPVRAIVLLVAAALGAVTTIAVVSLRAPQPAVIKARSVLEQQITDRQADVDSLTGKVADDSERIAALQSQALSSQYPGLLKTIETDSVTSGAAAVSGPGVRVTISDAPDAVAGDGTVDPDKRVQDTDLQSVVNALWAAGAEAVSINGQRLASTTAIRSAGSAILVDLVGLASPYHVDAIGSSDSLKSRFGASPAADELSVLSQSYGLSSSVRTEKHLSLRGAGSTTLYSARPLD
jgi:uncharacterized protein YlxW (UPF0749 family)